MRAMRVSGDFGGGRVGMDKRGWHGYRGWTGFFDYDDTPGNGASLKSPSEFIPCIPLIHANYFAGPGQMRRLPANGLYATIVAAGPASDGVGRNPSDCNARWSAAAPILFLLWTM